MLEYYNTPFHKFVKSPTRRTGTGGCCRWTSKHRQVALVLQWFYV